MESDIKKLIDEGTATSFFFFVSVLFVFKENSAV